MHFSFKFFTQDLRTITPVILNELCWGLAVVVYTAAYGRIDTDALASMQVVTTIQNLFIIFGFGLSGATAPMVGNSIGRGRTELAKTYAYRSLFLCLVIGLILSTIIDISSTSLFNIENISNIKNEFSLNLTTLISLILISLFTIGFKIWKNKKPAPILTIVICAGLGIIISCLTL